MRLSKLKELQKKFMVVKKSKIKGAGKGVFAKIDIPKGTVLGWYRGKYLTEKQFEKLPDSKTDYVWYINDNLYVDGSKIKKNNMLIYVNGAKTKAQKKKINVDSHNYRKKIWYKTTKKIKKGDELIVDYGEEYFI